MEHAVIVHVPFKGGDMGSEQEREEAFALVEELEEAVSASDAGEYDGEEFGGGECAFYIYGPDADRLFTVVEPILRASQLASGAYAIKRYGDAGDEDAREERVDL